MLSSAHTCQEYDVTGCVGAAQGDGFPAKWEVTLWAHEDTPWQASLVLPACWWHTHEAPTGPPGQLLGSVCGVITLAALLMVQQQRKQVQGPSTCIRSSSRHTHGHHSHFSVLNHVKITGWYISPTLWDMTRTRAFGDSHVPHQSADFSLNQRSQKPELDTYQHLCQLIHLSSPSPWSPPSLVRALVPVKTGGQGHFQATWQNLRPTTQPSAQCPYSAPLTTVYHIPHSCRHISQAIQT